MFMFVDILDIARTEVLFLGRQHDHGPSLEDVLAGELNSPLRSEIARLRLQCLIREYIQLPARAIDAALRDHWSDLELVFMSGQTLH